MPWSRCLTAFLFWGDPRNARMTFVCLNRADCCSRFFVAQMPEGIEDKSAERWNRHETQKQEMEETERCQAETAERNEAGETARGKGDAAKAGKAGMT